MAEAAIPGRQALCRYFSNGICRFGRDCRFSHDREQSAPDNKCRYYLAGNCSFGSRCRYDHSRPQQPSTDRPVPVPRTYSASSHGFTQGGARSKREDSSWAAAKEFVPCTTSNTRCNDETGRSLGKVQNSFNADTYREAVRGFEKLNVNDVNRAVELCPFTEKGQCPYGDSCQYVHGDVCELCDKPCLHPYDEENRRRHKAECMKVLEDDMKLSFAISRSNDKVCGICMDTVLEKSEVRDRRFGILTGCNHVYCLSCIREWRGRKEYKTKVVRSCPECRVHSDFILPAPYWFENDEEKNKMISDYKRQLSKKSCKYFDQGRGRCPFGSLCFYLHAFPDGSIAKDESPPRPRPRRVRGSTESFRAIQESLLWDFLEEREERGERLSALFELDDDLVLHLLETVGEGDMESDDASSYYSDFEDVPDEQFDSDEDLNFNRIRFLTS